MNDTGAQPKRLYESAAKIYPRTIWGRFQKLRMAAMAGLLGLYYLAPWLSWNGQPLILLDLPARRFHVLWLTLVPQDLILLAGLLLIAALTLFLFTALAGRLWCGYACPQTVWTEAFLWLERLAEGDRHARMKLDRSPWTLDKLWRKSAKHALWLLLALYTGLTFVAFFVPARELFTDALRLDIGGWPLFWSLFYGFATWGNAGFMREQVCKYMCPYARFQSAMFDTDTLIIAYDGARGEPRKSTFKKAAAERARPLSELTAQATATPRAGDCVDCTLCVQVCPMGIDIRNGLQYECIACAACVDVCDSVMDSVGKPRGLVRYTSDRNDQTGKVRMLRPRVVGYAIVWALAGTGLLTLLLTHNPLRFDVLRDRHSLYRELPTGALENVYTFKVTNEDGQAHRFRIRAVMADGGAIEAVPDSVDVAPGATEAITVSLRTAPLAEAAVLPAVLPISVSLSAEDEPRLERTRSARFLTGFPP